MFEPLHAPLLPLPAYRRRLVRQMLIAAAILVVCLSLGIAGFHWLARLAWPDAFVDAAMVLAGMGAPAALHTTAGKLFAGCYALLSGVAFLSTIGLLLAPVVHRFLHKFHLEPPKPGS